MSAEEIEYSEKYCDEYFEYRHVFLPKDMLDHMSSDMKKRLLSEDEWRGIGVQQSRGWKHYMVHLPEPHILLFRRPLGTDSRTGKAPPGWVAPKHDEGPVHE